MTRRAAVALAVFVFAFAGSAAGASTSAQIEVTARVSHTNVARLPPAGRGGDAVSSLWIVRDRHGQAVGDMLVACRWVTRGLQLCAGQLSLPLGAIAVIGASRTRFLGQLAVVGGTGRYVGADGTLLFKATGASRYVLSVQYRQP